MFCKATFSSNRFAQTLLILGVKIVKCPFFKIDMEERLIVGNIFDRMVKPFLVEYEKKIMKGEAAAW